MMFSCFFNPKLGTIYKKAEVFMEKPNGCLKKGGIFSCRSTTGGDSEWEETGTLKNVLILFGAYSSARDSTDGGARSPDSLTEMKGL